MNISKRLLVLFLMATILLGACNLPRGGESAENEAALTAAAMTVQALTTPTATPTRLLFGTPSFTPIGGLPATSTSIAATIPPPATATSNCNRMEFVADVTIPDGTLMNPNQGFTKTWRLKNSGTCSWSTSYAIVFSSGNSMNGPASQNLPGPVGPGQTVDVSVNLTAPATAGDYTGNWKIRDASGVLFGSFYVQIKVQTATPTPTSTLPPAIAQVVLSNLAAEGGQVRSDGSVLNPPNVGDIESNVVAEAFFSFDTSGIPAGATITKVVVDFSSYDTLGNPWSLSDGCVRAYVQNYGTLDASDFFAGDPTGAVIRWCGASELSTVAENVDMKSVVQSAVGTSRLKLRIQFRTPNTNSNGIADMIRFGTVKLTITYQ